MRSLLAMVLDFPRKSDRRLHPFMTRGPQQKTTSSPSGFSPATNHQRGTDEQHPVLLFFCWLLNLPTVLVHGKLQSTSRSKLLYRSSHSPRSILVFGSINVVATKNSTPTNNGPPSLHVSQHGIILMIGIDKNKVNRMIKKQPGSFS